MENQELEFKFNDVELDTLFKMREYLESEHKNIDDEDNDDERLNQIKDAIDYINCMCYYKIKKEQDEAYKRINKKLNEIDLKEDKKNIE